MFGQNWLYSGKLFVLGQNWLYSGKLVVFVKFGVIWVTFVVFGQNYL